MYLFLPPMIHRRPLTGEFLLLPRLLLTREPIPAPGGRRWGRQPEGREAPGIEPETSHRTDWWPTTCVTRVTFGVKKFNVAIKDYVFLKSRMQPVSLDRHQAFSSDILKKGCRFHDHVNLRTHLYPFCSHTSLDFQDDHSGSRIQSFLMP